MTRVAGTPNRARTAAVDRGVSASPRGQFIRKTKALLEKTLRSAERNGIDNPHVYRMTIDGEGHESEKQFFLHRMRELSPAGNTQFEFVGEGRRRPKIQPENPEELLGFVYDQSQANGLRAPVV